MLIRLRTMLFCFLAATLSSFAPIHALTAVVVSTPESELVVTGNSAWLTFGLDRVPFLRHQVLGNPLWQYVASFIFIVLAFYAAKLLDQFMQVQLRKWAQRTSTKIDDLLVELLRGPIKIITFVI